MPKKIMLAFSNAEGDCNKEVHCKDMDKSDYDSKYKGHLTCINECKARIKYTERKDGVKFFSTWNKEGSLHDGGCPYHVDYKGKKGREKLIAFYKSVAIDDDTILRRLKWKVDSLTRKYNKDDIEHPENGSAKVVNTGADDVEVPIESKDGEKSTRLPDLKHKDANFVTKDDRDCMKSVYGFIDNVQFVTEENGEAYAYFNLVTKNSKVNIYFPEAFYKNEDSKGVKEFEAYIKKVAKMVEKNPGEILAIAYGNIKQKKKMGLNVNVTAPKRILVNKKTYLEIISLTR